jgi:peptidoglycan/LPS O-acetylase OafA/YrhL
MQHHVRSVGHNTSNDVNKPSSDSLDYDQVQNRSIETPRSDYLPGLDSGRLIAAFGVIAIHIAPADAIATGLCATFAVFAVPFFLLTSLRLFIGSIAKKMPRNTVHGNRTLISEWSNDCSRRLGGYPTFG